MSNRRHIIPVVDKMPKDLSADCEKCPIIQTAVGDNKASAESMKETVDKIYLLLNGSLEVRGVISRLERIEDKIGIKNAKGR